MKSTDDDTGPRALRFARVVLGVAAACCVLELLLAFPMRSPLPLKVAYGALAAAFVGAMRLRPARRVSVALLIAPVIAGAYLLSYVFARRHPPAGTAAILAGRGWDSRGIWEVVDDLGREGKTAYPSISPRTLLTTEYVGFRMHLQEMLPVVDGVTVVPLAPLSNTTTVLCNEGGFYPVYESDERGFNNPKGLWGRDRIDVAAVGDSFTQGFCVAPEKSAPGRIRERYPATLNAGVGGNGPLLELGAITEYLSLVKPRVVLWFHYNNDLLDLDVERRNPVLIRYLEDGFQQGVVEKQAKIDAAIKDVLATKIEPLAPRWPAWLASMGLSRRSTPLFLQDLVMGESRSGGAAVIRLDEMNGALAAKIAPPKGGRRKPDFAFFQRVLTTAKARVAAWGGQLYFVYVPDVPYLRSRGAHWTRDAVLESARLVGLPIIDVHPVFLAQPDPTKLMFHDKAHCNEEGYQLMASTVLAALEGKL